MTLPKALVAAVVVGSLALAACSSSTAGHGQDTTPPSHAALAAIVLQPGDLPAGWTGKAPTPDTSSDSDVQAQVTKCVGTKSVNDANQVEKVDSDDYDQGNDEISSDATAYKTQDEVNNRLDVMLSPKADACFNASFKSALEKSLPSGGQIGSPSFKITKGDPGGPSNVVAQALGQVTFTEQGQSVKLYLQATYIKGPLLGVSIEFTGVGQPIAQSVQTKAIAAVAKRAAQA